MTGTLFQKEPEKQPVIVKNAFEEVDLPLRSGDIVLRSGKGFISDMFKRTSIQQTKFSHAGVLVVENGTLYVYHMLGTAEKKLDGLRKDKLSDFCSSKDNIGYAIYRYRSLAGKEQAVVEYLKSLSKQKPVFDEAFDLTSENALYCTEMIYKSLLRSSGYQLPISTIKGKSYIGIDNLYLNTESIKLTEVFY